MFGRSVDGSVGSRRRTVVERSPSVHFEEFYQSNDPNQWNPTAQTSRTLNQSEQDEKSSVNWEELKNPAMSVQSPRSPPSLSPKKGTNIVNKAISAPVAKSVSKPSPIVRSISGIPSSVHFDLDKIIQKPSSIYNNPFKSPPTSISSSSTTPVHSCSLSPSPLRSPLLSPSSVPKLSFKPIPDSHDTSKSITSPPMETKSMSFILSLILFFYNYQLYN
jgi:hypothetical protein